VRPWEWDRLSVEEADHLLDWLDQYEKDVQEQEAKLRR
jgi:hypothetical protein